MKESDLKIAYKMVKNFKKYDTMSNPPKINNLEYTVPYIDGLHPEVRGKNIDEVYPNTLVYILYYLHGSDIIRTIDALMALLYYWQFRRREPAKMEEVYKDIVHHYTISNQPYKHYVDSKLGECIYLVKLSIGSKTLYKVGVTEDIHSRLKNLQSDVQTSYPLVSIGLEPINVVYTDGAIGVEELILDDARKTITSCHKFNFKGSTEAFKDSILIDLFHKCTSAHQDDNW